MALVSESVENTAKIKFCDWLFAHDSDSGFCAVKFWARLRLAPRRTVGAYSRERCRRSATPGEVRALFYLLLQVETALPMGGDIIEINRCWIKTVGQSRPNTIVLDLDPDLGSLSKGAFRAS
jgi:hypothetical protein